jgi:hypothetical protein
MGPIIQIIPRIGDNQALFVAVFLLAAFCGCTKEKVVPAASSEPTQQLPPIPPTPTVVPARTSWTIDESAAPFHTTTVEFDPATANADIDLEGDKTIDIRIHKSSGYFASGFQYFSYTIEAVSGSGAVLSDTVQFTSGPTTWLPLTKWLPNGYVMTNSDLWSSSYTGKVQLYYYSHRFDSASHMIRTFTPRSPAGPYIGVRSGTHVGWFSVSINVYGALDFGTVKVL